MQSNLENLETIFDKMNNSGFDTKEPLKWVFYFIDATNSKLAKLYEELRDHGYKIEKLDSELDDWILKVSKIEILTPMKLHKRNIAFNELAAFCDVSLYDGWEVEKLSDGSKS